MIIKNIITDKKHVDKIFHLADIHIRPYKRHKEYIEVFNKLYSSISGQCTPNSIIVLAGDIVHAKTEMSPELIDILFKFLLNLCNICDVILIPGNHDGNLNNLNRLDALSPVVDSLNLKNLFYLKDSGVYAYADLYFSNMSVFDSSDKYILAKEIPEFNKKVALFHGTVNNSVNDFNLKLKSNINLSMFNGFDLVLLGDIHKTQFLKNNICYCGSLIQQNHGESLEHGYILWDLSDISSQFIPIPNDYGYYTLDVYNNTDITSEDLDLPNKCRLRIKSHNIGNDKLNKIILEIKKKYSPIEITINKINNSNYNDGENVSFELPDVHDINNQNSLLETELIRTPDCSIEDIEEIKKINSKINSRIEVEDIIRNVKWNPIKFEWSNMFSYGENNIIDMSKLKGIVGLFAPNSAGKSSLIDSLSFCLFDKTARDFKPINILNNKKNNFSCTLEFGMSDTIYAITRKIYKNKKGDPQYKIEFSSKENNSIVSLNGENRWDTNRTVFSKIGTYEDFTLTSLSAQNKGAGFIDKGHSERKDLVIQFMGLGIFDKLFAIAQEEIKQLSTSIKILSGDDWEIKLINSNRELKTLSKEYKLENSKKTKITNNIAKYQNKISTLKSKLVNVNNTFDIKNLKFNVDKFNEQLKEKILELNKLKTEIENNNIVLKDIIDKINIFESIKIESMYDEYQQLILNKNKLVNDIKILKFAIDNKNEKMKNLEELEYDPECSYCMNNIFVKDAINTKSSLLEDQTRYDSLLLNKNALESIIISNTQTKNNYSEYTELKTSRSNAEIKRHQLELKLNKLQSEINGINIDIINTDNNIKEYELNKTFIEKNKLINSEIENYDTLLNNNKNELLNIDSVIMRIYGKIEVEKSNRITYLNNIEKLSSYNRSIDLYKKYTNCIKRDGIPYKLIQNIIPIIESEINNILSQIVDFSIVINLDDSKNINMFIVYDENNYWPLELSGGMEKFISSIAIRVALTNISNLPRPNFLIIDEGWGTLDSENLNSVNMLMDYLKTQFDFVLIVSHIDQIKDVADILIDIKKENGFSHISYN